MRHMHIYVAFVLRLAQDYQKHAPPFVPRSSYSAEKNRERQQELLLEWQTKAYDHPHITWLTQLRAMVFDFTDPATDTLLAVPDADARVSFVTLDRSEDPQIALRYFRALNELVNDQERIEELGELYPSGCSIRGSAARRFRVQARYEVMRSRKMAFDDIEKCLYLQTNTYELKSILSGQEAQVDDLVDMIGIKSSLVDEVSADLDISLQLFRRAGLIVLPTSRFKIPGDRHEPVDDE